MTRRLRVAGALLGVAALVGVVAASVWTSPARASITYACTTPVDQVNASTGSDGCPDFVVPAGVTSVTFQVWGAAGGAAGTGGSGCTLTTAGRTGGEVTATYTVSPGEAFHVYVGAKGNDGACGGAGGAGGTGGAGGFNGDGNGANGGAGSGTSNLGGGGGGGGESDVRLGDTAATSRLVIAGGGGGAGASGAAGGLGGGSPAGDGATSSGSSSAVGGAGATSLAVGAGGSGGTGPDGSPGIAATGGAGATATDAASAGGGGGGGAGFFGGGGGEAGAANDGGGGGGGGSGAAQILTGVSRVSVTQTNGSDAQNNGNGKIVITYTEPPQTGIPTGITATGATLVGYDENNDTYHFEYGLDTSYGTSTAETPSVAGQTIKVPVTGLTPATTYHYRIVSRDSPVPGDDVSFTTLALPVTGSATNLTATDATLQGTDANSGESYHFEYGTTTAYGSSTASATSGSGTLSAAIHGLRAGTTYHFRIVSDAGAGSDQTFSTLHIPVTLPADSITASSAVLKGFDTNPGTSYRFEYGTTTAYGQSTPSYASLGTTADLSVTVTGLQPGTKYHYRIVDSSSGPGPDATFTTLTSGGGGSGGGGGGGGGGGKPAHDLVLGLHAPLTGAVGRPLRYVATVGNRGTKPVAGAKLKLVFRGGTVQVVSARGCKGTMRLTCSVPKVPAGKAVRLKIVVRLAKAAKLTVTGSLVTTFKDPTPKNNRATRHTTVK